MINKRSLKSDLDLDENEYQELKKKGLLPDKSEQAMKRFEELMQQGPPFNSDELMFLGKMDVVKLYSKYPAEAEYYMHL
ncbi:MAG TPA: hypothetical protein P5084_08065 [Paludibacter sp.]|nr:hypothetical protein [Paludibacter sp.]